MKKMFLAALCTLSLVYVATAADKASEAIVTLLNSRASGSRSEFREAAKIVAAGAKEGRPLQQFVIALVTNDRDIPRKLRLKPETRKEYLDQSRDKIRRLAEEKNNALAWYLLSLETNNLSFLKRAADGDNVQALNAWAPAFSRLCVYAGCDMQMPGCAKNAEDIVTAVHNGRLSLADVQSAAKNVVRLAIRCL